MITPYLDHAMQMDQAPESIEDTRKRLWAGDFIPLTAVVEHIIPELHLEGSPEWEPGYRIGFIGWMRKGCLE